MCGEDPTCQCRRHKRRGFCPWVGKMPWRRAWQPTPGFLPRESHGQRSLARYSPQGHTELDTTEATQHSGNNSIFSLRKRKRGVVPFWVPPPTPQPSQGPSRHRSIWAGARASSAWTGQRVTCLVGSQGSVPPVMAFHLGSLGFLTPFNFENFQSQVTQVIQGELGCS